MSLAALAWRRLPEQTLGAATIAALLDTIWTAYTSATYANGAARTPGAGSAWTFSRFQSVGVTEAVYGTPPTDTLGLRAIFAGKAAAAPTMASPDTFLASTPLGGINKNSGAFNAWDAAAPFTSGSFTGYWRWAAATAVVIGAKVRCYEAQEALAVTIEDAAGAIYGGLLGAIVDPESTDVAQDAESDAKLYGMITSGSSGAIEAGFNGSDGSIDDWLTQAGASANGGKHAGIFTPGAGTLDTILRLQGLDVSTTTTLRSRSGRYYRVPITYYRNAAAPNDRVVGWLRGAYAFADGRAGQVLSEVGVEKGYLVGGSSTADQDCILLATAQ